LFGIKVSPKRFLTVLTCKVIFFPKPRPSGIPKCIKRFEEIGEELGMKAVKLDEPYTSKTCSLCGEAHERGRVKRCSSVPVLGKVINADLNGAVNILHIPKFLGTKS
jgi:transposase